MFMKNLKTYHVITIKNIKLSFYAVLCLPVFCRILTFLSTKFIMNQFLLPRQQTKLLIKTALWVAKITINKLLQIEINYKSPEYSQFTNKSKEVLVMSPSRAGLCHSSSWRIFSSARLGSWPFSLQLEIENWPQTSWNSVISWKIIFD